MSSFQFLQRKYLTLLLLVLVLTGCVAPPFKAYKGEKEIDDLAVIKGEERIEEGFIFDERMYTFITYVDNKPTSKIYSGMADTVFVEPGRHYLQVNYSHNSMNAFSKLWLDAEKGKIYIVKSKENGLRVFFWLEDEETGERVGGIPGGEPENQKEN